CVGSNNTLARLLPNVAAGTTVFVYDSSGFHSYTFNGTSWSDPNVVIGPGTGFVLQSQAAGTLTFEGCEPNCPLPCLPYTNRFVLVGRHGLGDAFWTNISSCPPICGTRVHI